MFKSSTTLIFVFGSNLAGRHGKGAALFAKQKHGAVQGQGVGRTGNAYAIPTKDENLNVLSLEEIERYVKDFRKYAKKHKELTFLLTPVGTGLAGYSIKEMRSMFADMPNNVTFAGSWNK